MQAERGGAPGFQHRNHPVSLATGGKACRCLYPSASQTASRTGIHEKVFVGRSRRCIQKSSAAFSSTYHLPFTVP